MPAAPGREFAFVAEFQQGVNMLGAFQVNTASPAAVAAARSAARHELLTTKSHAAVSAVTACDVDFCFVNKHRKARPEAVGPDRKSEIRNQKRLWIGGVNAARYPFGP